MRWIALAGALAVAAAGCAESHVRSVRGDAQVDDATVPGRIEPGCIPTSVPPGGYSRSEVFVETYTPVCGEPPLEGVPTAPPIGVCVVYGLEGDPRPGCTEHCASPEEAAERTFCSCRCGGDPGTGPFCACPTGSRCEGLIAHGGWSGGAFCVPQALAPR